MLGLLLVTSVRKSSVFEVVVQIEFVEEFREGKEDMDLDCSSEVILSDIKPTSGVIRNDISALLCSSGVILNDIKPSGVIRNDLSTLLCSAAVVERNQVTSFRHCTQQIHTNALFR